jgi:hypothetical protein
MKVKSSRPLWSSRGKCRGQWRPPAAGRFLDIGAHLVLMAWMFTTIWDMWLYTVDWLWRPDYFLYLKKTIWDMRVDGYTEGFAPSRTSTPTSSACWQRNASLHEAFTISVLFDITIHEHLLAWYSCCLCSTPCSMMRWRGILWILTFACFERLSFHSFLSENWF